MSTEKGVKLDTGKLKMSLIPQEALIALAEVLTFGAEKYTPDGWRTVKDAKTRYTDALLRHYCAYQSGEENDSESGLSHLKHMLTNIAFLVTLDSDDKKDIEDNKPKYRYIVPGTAGKIVELSESLPTEFFIRDTKPNDIIASGRVKDIDPKDFYLSRGKSNYTDWLKEYNKGE